MRFPRPNGGLSLKNPVRLEMKNAIFLLTIALLFTCSQANADNWGHWRGPGGNSAASNATPPTEWSQSKNVKWKVAIPGKGSGSPVVWEDKVFVVSAVPAGGASAQAQAPERPQRQAGGRPGSRGGRRGNSGPLPKLQFKLFCFDRESGKELWQQTAVVATPHEGTHGTNGFASASPCTDGKHVYAHFGSRGLFCYTMDGELKWKREDFGNMKCRAGFGEGSSPTLAGDMIIVPWDHEGPSFIYALNKTNGETIWKTKRDEPTNWSTPLVVEHNGKKQVIMNGQTNARSYDLETGKELWRCGGQTDRPAASAVSADGIAFVGSGFRGSFLGAFNLDGTGNIKGTENVVWSINQNTPDIASPLLSDGRIYFYKGKSGILSCLDAATGKKHFSETRVPGVNSTYASPVAAGGYIYLTDRSGTIVVIKNSDKMEVVASNKLGEGVDATPAPVANQLFIRGEKNLYCISE